VPSPNLQFSAEFALIIRGLRNHLAGTKGTVRVDEMLAHHPRGEGGPGPGAARAGSIFSVYFPCMASMYSLRLETRC
jgi:hypothetical protein